MNPFTSLNENDGLPDSSEPLRMIMTLAERSFRLSGYLHSSDRNRMLENVFIPVKQYSKDELKGGHFLSINVVYSPYI